MVETLITAANYRQITAEEQKAYFQTALDFISGVLESRIISLSSMDEERPYHLCFVITPDNKQKLS